MELDVQPGHVAADDALDVQEGHVAAGAPGLLDKIKGALGVEVPGFKEARGVLGEASDLAGEAGGQIGDFVARKTGSPGLGVAAGALPTLGSAALKEVQGFVPATTGDLAFLAATEGAGPLAKAAGMEAPAVKTIARTVGGALMGGAGAHATGGGALRTTAGAVTGGAIAGLAPEAVRRAVTETPLPVPQKIAVAAAKELGLPTFLDQVSNSPIASWLGNLLRSHSSSAAEMGAADIAQSQALTDAKTRVLQELGPSTSVDQAGKAVAAEAGPKLAASNAKRLAEYAPERAQMTNPFPAPALPEERSAALRGAASENQAAQNATRKGLYNAVDALLPPDKGSVKVPLTEPVENNSVVQPAIDHVQDIVDEAGLTREGRKSKAFQIGTDILKGPQETQDAVAALKTLLNDREAAWEKQKTLFRPELVANMEKNPALVKGLTGPFQTAWQDRNLAAMRAQIGDVGVLGQRPDIAAQLPPEMAAAIKDHGSMPLDQLDQHIQKLSDAAESPEGRKFKADGKPGNHTDTGRQLLIMRDALSKARADFLGQNFPDALAAEQKADLFHAGYDKTFQNKHVAGLYSSDPIGTFNSIVNKDSMDVDALKVLNDAVGPKGQPILKRHLLDKALGDPTKIPSQADLLNSIADLGPAFRTLFNPMEQAGIKNFAKTGDMPQFLQSAYEAKLQGFMDKPQAIVGSMLANGGDVTLARAVKRYTSPETFGRIGRLVMDDILTPSGSQPEKGAAGILGRLDSYSQPFLETFYDPAVLKRARLIGSAAELLPGYGDLKNLPAPANPALTFTHGGAAISPKTVGRGLIKRLPGDAAMFLIGKDELMRMYADPTMTGPKLLSTMMKTPDYDPRWGDLLKRATQAGYLQIHSSLRPTPAPTENTATP